MGESSFIFSPTLSNFHTFSMYRLKLFIFLLLFFPSFFVVSSCSVGKTGNTYGNSSLPSSVDGFYKMMMWKYFEKATLFVHPESRKQFNKFVLKKGDDLNLTKYNISEILETKPGVENIVKTYVTYYKYPSVSEKSEVLTDVWVKKGKAWYVKPDFHSEMFRW